MRFFKKILNEAKQVKKKVENLYEKIPDEQSGQPYRNSISSIDLANDMLRSTLKFSTYAPLIVESYMLLYGVYICYTIIKTVILVPIELIMGLANVALKSLKLYKSEYVSMHSLVVAFVAYIFTLNEDIFDISFLYHMIRGQSTVKVYAIIFAIEASEVVMTKLGIFLYKNIRDKLENKDVAFYKLFPEFLVESLYVFCHGYIIYIDFLIYSVVLNSSLQSFIIFWSVVYLTKMKTAPDFGLHKDKYKNILTDDSKYRVSRIIYFLLFLSNQVWASIPSLTYKFLFIIFVQEAVIVIKHLLYLLSSYTGRADTTALEIRNTMYETMYLKQNESSIDRCVSQNFTVLPFTVFTIKIISVIIYSNWEPNFLAYLTFYIILAILLGALFFVIIGIKSIEELAHQIRDRNLKKNTPDLDKAALMALLNSVCINVVDRYIPSSNQKGQNHEDDKESMASDAFSRKAETNMSSKSIESFKTPMKLKKASSFLEGLMMHATEISKHKESEQNLPDIPSIDEVSQNEDSFINQSRTTKISEVELRKMTSQL